ncbi:uncharacterized protein DS421_11g320300 [Arachis hypogaea]|nr:uncharacterized protein DS421_11g320300 [Arachis hypogaea]
MLTSRGAADQAASRGRSRGRGRGRVSSSTPRTSGSSPSTPTTPVMPQVLPPAAQQPASTSTLPLAMDATAPESSHACEAATDAPPSPPIVQLKIWPDGGTGCTLGGMLSTTLPSGRYSTIEWVDGSSRCWMIFKALFVYWKTDKGFRHQRLTNKANRASVRSSKYTSNSATFMKTKARLSKSLDREATLAETFKYTYTLKKNKETFADQRSHDHYSQKRREDATDGSAASIVDPDVVWHEIASAPYKNRHARELNNYLERYQEILNRVTSTDELRLEWRESLERMQHMEAQMEVYQAKMRTAFIDLTGGSTATGGSGPASGRRTSPPSTPPT